CCGQGVVCMGGTPSGSPARPLLAGGYRGKAQLRARKHPLTNLCDVLRADTRSRRVPIRWYFEAQVGPLGAQRNARLPPNLPKPAAVFSRAYRPPYLQGSPPDGL